MSLERFRLPETPESRMHRVVLLLLAICVVATVLRGGWRLLATLEFGPALLGIAAAAAIAIAVRRYLRQPAA